MLFDAFVSRKRSSWKQRTIFIGSIVLHVGGAIGILGYSLLHVEELPPPEVTITFVNAPPPPPAPPPPAAAGAAPRRVAKTRLTPKPKTVAAAKPPPPPAPGPPPPAPPPPAPASPEPQSAPAPPSPPGAPAGVPGGVPNAPPAPPPPPPAAPPPRDVKMVPNFVIDKERLSAPDPRLPEEFTSRNAGKTFSAVYRICVGTDGRVFQAAIVSPIGGGVDEGILAQIRKSWVYKPQPLAVCSHRAFVFKIKPSE